MICPKCNTENKDGSAFCKGCGYRLLKRKFSLTQTWLFLIVSVIVILIYVLYMNLFTPENMSVGQIRENVSGTKKDLQSLAAALEAYYIDNNSYPLPDYDQNGKTVIPHILTTPIAYMTRLFNDKFKDKGKGYYEYGGDIANGWIATSYGPDRVDGNSDVPSGKELIESDAWSDKVLSYRLESSPLTYDPTNGSNSSGDIWRRGP